MKAKTKQEEQPYDLADAPTQPDWQEQTRRRAYELSQQRDSNGGDEVSDWYRAEAETRVALGTNKFDSMIEEEEPESSFGARA